MFALLRKQQKPENTHQDIVLLKSYFVKILLVKSVGYFFWLLLA